MAEPIGFLHLPATALAASLPQIAESCVTQKLLGEGQNMTVQADVHPVHIHEMMARLGIERDAVVSPRSGLRCETALHRCEACPAEKECKVWLDHAPAAITSAPWFCLNADILFELQYDQPGPRRLEKEPAGITDLEHLEEEIDEALINLIDKSGDDLAIEDLRRRKLNLKDKIEWLRHVAIG